MARECRFQDLKEGGRASLRSAPGSEDPREISDIMLLSQMETRIFREAVSFSEIESFAQEQFGDFVKAVVDVERKLIAVGGELHSDQEAILLADGSTQENLWGINLYPSKSKEDWVEFDSMINVRPSRANRSRGVENAEIRARILSIVQELIRK